MSSMHLGVIRFTAGRVQMAALRSVAVALGTAFSLPAGLGPPVRLNVE